MPSTSAILELQELARSQTSVTDLLRHAKAVASKLGLDEFEEWIRHEMNGYPDAIKVPEYRTISSKLMSTDLIQGRIPIALKDDSHLVEYFSRTSLAHPISQILHILQTTTGPTFESELSPKEQAKLPEEVSHRLPLVRRYSTSSLASIPDAVRDNVLDWALRLEKQGVAGEGMIFTQKDRQIAQMVTINNFGSLIQGDHANLATANNSPGAAVSAASGDARTHQRLFKSIEAVKNSDSQLGEALTQLANAISSSKTLASEKKTEATEQLAFVAEQCALPAEQRQPKTIHRHILWLLRETLGLGADVLQVWTTFGPMLCAALSVSLS
ncbi:hypothetical protein [Myxococcus xanthus]|uniref:AbiTii domain-containing protein n=1 Tax=Myxococcus xanthus TaxID=34 RepID=UPI00112DEBB6|nr:hypothetical protein [Myxococcus xanthus]